MKILILTQYFPPEVGAPQNRLYELALRLKKKGARITVLTAMPNYPKMQVFENYRGKSYVKELMDGMEIHRSYIFVSENRSIASRLLNYFSFVFTSMFYGLFKIGKQDYILCESPPLFLGISAVFLKIFKKAELIFNVSDLWPESAEKLGIINNRFLLSASTALEEFLYARSEFITCQTQGILKNIKKRFPQKKLHWLPNGVDISRYPEGKQDLSFRRRNGFSDGDFLLLYAGIIGHAQGLEVILYAAEKLKDQQSVKFLLVGNGPEKQRLLEMKEKMGLLNVFFFDLVGKEEIPGLISSVDAAVIPLKKIDLFKGAIPSKIFENLAMKKPILLGVEGEAKDLFIDEGKCGIAFEPENGNDLAEKVLLFYSDRNLVAQMGANGKKYVTGKFNRDLIADSFWNFFKQNS